MPLPPRRRRAPRRPAGARDGAGVRRDAAVARRDGGDLRTGGVRRRDRLPRAVGGPDPAHPAPAVLDPGQAAADGHVARPAARAGTAPALTRGSHARRTAAAHLPQPAPRPGLPLRPRWRAQRREGLHQGGVAGDEADLHRGPVPLGTARRRPLLRGAAQQPRPARDRSGAVVHRPGGVHGPDAADARACPGDAADEERRARPGRDLRHREPPGHAGLRAREGVPDRRHLGDHRVRQLQPPLVDARLGAVGRGGGPVGGRPLSLRTPAAADPGGGAPRP